MAIALRTRNLLSVGRTVAEAFFYLYTLEYACKVQVDVMASGATAKKIDAESLRRIPAPALGVHATEGGRSERLIDALLAGADPPTRPARPFIQKLYTGR
jgi:hypothetical protein